MIKCIHVQNVEKSRVFRYRLHRNIWVHYYKKISFCFIFRFLSVSYLNAHVRGVHELKNAQICDFCGKIIKSKQAMTQHRLYAHTDNPKVQCVECGSW